MLIKKEISKSAQTGAALVEFAIVVPLLLLLVVGISEFGYAFYHLNILNKSVQDGARYFSDPLRARNGVINAPIDVSTTTNGTNIARTQNLVIYGNIATGTQLLPDAAPVTTVYCAEEYNAANPSASSNKVCLTTTQHIMVTATYNHNFILGNVLNNIARVVVPNNPGNLVTNPYTFTASSVLRVE